MSKKQTWNSGCDGVRRAKVYQMFGKESILAEDHAGNIFEVSINKLLSPKSHIDISKPLDFNRFKNVFEGVRDGKQMPRIYVNKGNEGTSISDVKLKR